MRYHLASVRMALLKKAKDNSVGEQVDTGNLVPGGEECNKYRHDGKQDGISVGQGGEA